jgi:hypothetical protein
MSARTAAGPMTAALAGLLAAGALVAGCGTKPAASAAPPPAPAAPPLATSFASTAGTGWAIVEMGGSAAQENNFWQIFVRPAATAPWRLATPLGVADNGGLVVTSPGAGSLLTGFVPSQLLEYSPLAASSDNGVNWSAAGPVNPGLAGVPDSLAAGPDGRLIALTTGGAEIGERSGASWTRLSSANALGATAAGQACGVTGLTAAAFSSSGTPLLAASCARRGAAGIFADSNGWHAAGPVVPAWLAREDIDVLRLTATGAGLVALLEAGAGRDTSITAAWYDGGRWTLSAPLHAGPGPVRSTAVGPGGSIGIILGATHGATLAGPGASWHALPALPAWAATLALGPGGGAEAITAHGGTFSDWRLASGSRAWTLAQTIHVSIPYGSSG